MLVAFVGLIAEYLGDGSKRPGAFVIPHVMSQDYLENKFGLIRSMVGNDRHRNVAATLRAVAHSDRGDVSRDLEPHLATKAATADHGLVLLAGRALTLPRPPRARPRRGR